MEDPIGQKQSPQVFPSITLSHLSSSAPSSSAASAFFSDDRSGCSRLRFHQPCSPVPVFDLDLRKIQVRYHSAFLCFMVLGTGECGWCFVTLVFAFGLFAVQIFKLGLLELLCVTNETGDDDPEEVLLLYLNHPLDLMIFTVLPLNEGWFSFSLMFCHNVFFGCT